jgi:Na+-transporting NADH:ubiquinone oxidoreductase subunit NqrB
MNTIDAFLNKITMYRLVMYYLGILVGIAVLFGAIGWLPYNPVDLLFQTLFLLAACAIGNRMLAWFFHAHPNSESAYITALILTLIVTPQPIGSELRRIPRGARRRIDGGQIYFRPQ